MPLKSTWVIGDWREPEFAEAVDWLRANAECEFFESPAAARVNGNQELFPKAIVLVQSRSGRFRQQEVERLHEREPLARLIALTGPWCEGEGRSGKPVVGVSRVAWRNWRERLPAEMDCNVLTPRTASETERMGLNAHVTQHVADGCGLAWVCTARREAYNQISDALLKLGFAVADYGGDFGSAVKPEVIIFDGWDRVSGFHERFADEDGQLQARRVLLLHFPRPEDHVRAREEGVDAVVGQPLLVGDLKAAIAGTVSFVV